MIVKNFINGQITTGTEPIDPISGVSRGLYINSVLSGNSSSDTLVGLDINPSYSGTAGNYFGLRVSGDTIFATSGGTLVMRTFNTGNVVVGSPTDSGHKLDVNGNTRINGSIVTNNHYITDGSKIIGKTSGSGHDFISITGVGDSSAVTISVGDYGSYPKIAQIAMGSQGIHWQGYISFWTTNPTFAERMRVSYSGNILIGTTTDAGYRLDVNGDTRIKGAGATSGTTGFTVVNSSNEVALQVLNNKWIGMQVLSPSAPLHVYYPGTNPNTKTIAIFDGYQSPAQPEMQILVGTTNNNFGSYFGHKSDMGGFVKAVASSTYAMTWDNTSNIGFGGSPSGSNCVTIYPRNFNSSFMDTTGAVLRIASGTLQIVPQTDIPDVSIVGLGMIRINSNVLPKTYTNASNLYIDGPPTAGNSTTIINRWSIYVNSGSTYFGGKVMVGLTGDTGFQFTSSGSTLLRGSGTTSGTTSVVLQNSTGGTIAMIGDTGYYGINTTLPLANFHSRGLYNELYFQSPTTNSGRHDISFGFGSTGKQVRIMTEAAGGSGQGNLYIVAGSGDAGVATTSDANLIISNTATTLKKNVTIDNNVAGLTNPGLFISGYQPGAVTSGIYFRYSETKVAILSKPTGGSGNADFRIATVPTIGGSGNNPPQESDTKFMITYDTANTLINTTTDLGFKLSVSGSTLLRGSGTTSASYALATQNSSGGTTMVVNNAGSVLVGTTTDAGYKLDVNGSIRGQSGLWGGDVFLGNISGTRFIYLPSGYGLYIGSVGNTPTVLGDSSFSTTLNATINRFTLTHSQPGSEQVTKLVGNTSVNHLNPFFDIVAGITSSPPKEIDMRIYTDYYSGTQRWGNIILGHNGNNTAGNILMGTNVGNGSRLLVGGTVSGATLSTTRAVHIAPTLLATGNTTTLIGLDIQPTYSIGSYTGLTQIALRVSGGTQIIGSGSTGTTLSLFSVDGASGRLFDVTDDFTNSLFSVNTSSGVPVIEAFANNSVVMGTYGSNALVVSGRSTYFGVIPSDSNYRIISSGATLFSGGTMVIKGSGTTSSSTALSLQNSTGGTLIHVYDNGSATFGTSSNGGFKYRFVDENNLGFQITNGDAGGSTGRGTLIIGESSSNGRLVITTNTSIDTANIAYTYGGVISFSTGGTERMRLARGASNLLINTTTDSGHNLNVNGTSNFSGNMTLGGTATLGSTVIGSSGIAIGDGSSRGTWTLGVGYVVNMSNVSQSLGVGSVVPWMNNSISLGAGAFADSTSSQMIMVPMAMSATTMSSGSTAELYISNNSQSRLSIPDLSVINAMVTVDYIATCTLTGSSSSLVYNDVKAGTQKFYVKRWFINNVGSYFTISTPVDVYSQSDSAMSGATLSYEYVSASTFKVKFNAPPTANNSTFRCAATVRVTTYKD